MPAPLKVSMPIALDVQEGYSLRVTAVSPTDGSLVAGVNVGIVVLTANDGSANTTGPPVSDLGTWLLVPGPNA